MGGWGAKPSSLDPNEQVVTDERGEKLVLIRWAIGRPDRVVTLRQPLGYTSLWSGLMGAWLGPDHLRNPSLMDRGSATALSFAALLPDLRPRTKANFDEFTRPGGGDLVEGMAESVIYAGNPRSLHDFFDISLRNRRNNLIQVTPDQPHPIRVVEKPERFGLRRLGPAPYLPSFEGSRVVLRDLYYLGETPETSPLFIRCDAEEAKSREEVPSAPIVAQCEHFITVEPLSAMVQFRYRRVFLKDWREIQHGVEQLLMSFLGRAG